MRALDLHPGQRVLDVGCGMGEPALTIAPWVAPAGSVLGIDLSSTMLALARRRARERGVRNARFRVADVETFHWRGRKFDRAVSRFGLPFVRDVDAAVGRVHAALKRGGKLALAVWGPAERNQGFLARQRAVRPYLAGPEPDPASVPHPLRFADPKRLLASLRRAGFAALRTRAAHVVSVHPSPESFAETTLATSLSELAGRLSTRRRRELARRLAREALSHRARASVRLEGFAWIISAVRR